MESHRKKQLLVSLGMRPDDANTAVSVMENDQRELLSRRKSTDWKGLMSPLRQQIQSMASSQRQWSKDPNRMQLYSAYLALLRKTLEKLKAAQTLAELNNRTIPEEAATRGITELDGMRWTAWIPLRIREPFILEFEKLRGMSGYSRVTIPFQTRLEARANDRRWDIHVKHILTLAASTHADAPEQEFYKEALNVAANRKINTPAPMQWRHLLTLPRRRAYDALKGTPAENVE